MMKQDRYLLVILLAIIVVVILALVLFFVRRGDQQYGPDDTPAGVIRNFVLALQKGDYERSYGYLAEDQNKPSFDEFQNDLLTLNQELSRISIQLGETDQTGVKALVGLTLIHSAGGPFSEAYHEVTNALLARDQNGAWKIIRMPYPYWGPAWYLVNPPDK
jgi:hypothetical protein